MSVFNWILQDPEEEAKSKGGSRLAHDKRIKTYIRKYQQGSYTLQQYWTKIIAAKLDHGLENFKWMKINIKKNIILAW